MAAQAKRIFVTRRHQADAVDADQGVEFVGQGDGGADVVARQCIASKAWPVMRFDSECHCLRLAVNAGVVLPHQALQFGEFAHHITG